MRKILLAAGLFACSSAFAQIISTNPEPATPQKTNALFDVVVDNGSTSQNARAPQGVAAARFTRTVFIVTAAEMAAGSFTNGDVINAISFKYSVAQDVPTSGAFKVYLQNTSDASYLKPSTTWTNGSTGVIDGMTLAASIPSVTIPAATGYWDIPFSGGSSFTYTGGALYIAWEYDNPSGTTATAANTALCLNSLVGGSNGLRNSFSGTAMPTTLANSSAFRPATRLGKAFNNDAQVSTINTLGKLPMSYATPHAVTAIIRNNGDNALTNLAVTLNITGANTFTNIKNIASLASGATTTVTFDGFTPTVAGFNTIVVSLPSDNVNTNNSRSFYQEVTSGNTVSYSDTASATGSVGFGNGAGYILNKYTLPGSVAVTGVTPRIGNSATNVGDTIFGVLFSAAGTLLAQTADYVITVGDLGNPKPFTFAVPQNITGNTAFYIGLGQRADADSTYPVATQVESPGRPGTYYALAAAAGSPITEYTTLGRFMIDAVVGAALPVSLLEFRGEAKNGFNLLEWKTATEQSNKGFYLERSADGKYFSSISYVPSKAEGGSSNSYLIYNYRDEKPLSGTNYYRLKQVDLDGKTSYSAIVSVNAPVKELQISIYPNPASEIMILRLTSTAAEKSAIRIFDMSGRIVKQLVVSVPAGENQVELNVADLASGLYNLQLQNSRGETLIAPFIKK